MLSEIFYKKATGEKPAKKRCVIAGAGRVGQSVARELVRFGFDIVMIEKNKKTAAMLEGALDVRVIREDVLDAATLRQAVAEAPDVFIAVTESDEVNLAACLLAGKLGAVKKAARIRNEEWFSEGLLIPDELGLDLVIHPEAESVGHIDRILGIHGAFDYSEAAAGEASLIGFAVQEGLPIIGMPLYKVKEDFALDAFLIIGILRGGKFLVPSGADVIQADDRLWVLTAKETEPFLVAIFRKKEGGPLRRMVILGASLIGTRLAEMYSSRGVAVILVENDSSIARKAAERLEKVEVLNIHLESETEFLMDLDPESIDCFIAASTDSKDNMMMSLLAKRIGVRKVVVVTDETTYLPVLDSIGLDVVVNPHNLTAGRILTAMRKGMVRSVVMLRAGVADLLEFEVNPGSRMDGKRLQGAGFPKGAIVGMVIREGDLIIPDGATVFQGNDKVIVVTLREKIEAVEKLFSSGGLL
ncbi:MAG: Trk system potassium transporter TrkA [Nitrospinota bacterium]|nr:Trk system potassium transporter TrkA [Nitrospinota bacterium]